MHFYINLTFRILNSYNGFLFLFFFLFLAKRRAMWVYNLVAHEARSQFVNRAWVLASCKLAALIFTCIYPMVSAMTSYSSLTSRRIFVSRQHSTESDFEFPSMTKALMKSCLFLVCKTMFTIDESQAISHANRTANTRTPNCQSSQGKIWHRKILWSENADFKFNGASKQRWMEMAATNSGAERTSLNEFQMLKFFKSKWRIFWIISMCNQMVTSKIRE